MRQYPEASPEETEAMHDKFSETAIPNYLRITSEGHVEVATKEGIFKLREPTGNEFDSVERIAKNMPNITEFFKSMKLVAVALVEPKLGELDLLNKYKISTLKRLMEGVNLFVDETKSFLWDIDRSSSQTTGNISSSVSVSDSTKPRST